MALPCTNKQKATTVGGLSDEGVINGDLNGTLTSILEGQRTIDHWYTASQMICEACNNRLHLLDSVAEKKFGPPSAFITTYPQEKALIRTL